MTENKFLKAALKYREMGYSAIPIKGDKTPFIKWAEYQKKRADAEQMSAWWSKWPRAMVGIVTGEISGLTVLDPDTDAGLTALDEYLPDTLQTPTANTPGGGRHIWFKHVPGIPNKARVLTDVDVRNDGGYIVAPPSKNGKGKYAWLSGLRPTEVKPAAMPDVLMDTLLQFSRAP